MNDKTLWKLIAITELIILVVLVATIWIKII